MSNKTPEPEKESTSQTTANSPRGNNRSLLSCPINCGGLGAEGAPRVAADGGEERREEREGRATAARSWCPYHRLMFRHMNGEEDGIGRASAVAGFRLQHIIPSPSDTHTHTHQLCVCVQNSKEEGE